MPFLSLVCFLTVFKASEMPFAKTLLWCHLEVLYFREFLLLVVVDHFLVLGIARCFTFGGSRNRVLHDPEMKPRTELTKEQYMKKEEQTTINHFHEKLLKLKLLMKTEVSLTGKQFFYTRRKFVLI